MLLRNFRGLETKAQPRLVGGISSSTGTCIPDCLWPKYLPIQWNLGLSNPRFFESPDHSSQHLFPFPQSNTVILLPIFRKNFRFLWNFEKSGSHCILENCLTHLYQIITLRPSPVSDIESIIFLFRFEEDLDDYSVIMVKALADRLAEVSILSDKFLFTIFASLT